MTATTPTADLLEPTLEERNNGWTAKTLTAYIKERTEAQTEAILGERKVKPKSQNHRYNPKHWR